MHQAVEAGPHGADAEQAALDMAERIVGLHGLSQFPTPGEIDENRQDGEGRAVEGDLSRGYTVAGELDAGLHRNKHCDRTDFKHNAAEGIRIGKGHGDEILRQAAH